MHILHRIVGMTLNPLGITIGLLAFGVMLRKVGWRRLSRVVFMVDLIAVIFMSLPITSEWIVTWLERDYPCMRVENLPAADAIVLLGGGVSGVPKGSDFPYPNLKDGADRVWHAARIWHAKAAQNNNQEVANSSVHLFSPPQPQLKIYCTCPDVSRSTPPFLMDLGVPKDDIVPLDGPHNTQEEAMRYAEVLRGKRVYLVTSAAHMKRAMIIFAKYAPEIAIVPAAIDHIYIETPVIKHPFLRYVPSFETFCQFNVLLHELLGLVRYSF